MQVQDMVDAVMAMPEGARAYLLAPIVRDRKGEYKKEFLDLRKQGFQRIKVDGAFYELEEPPVLDKKFPAIVVCIEIVVVVVVENQDWLSRRVWLRVQMENDVDKSCSPLLPFPHRQSSLLSLQSASGKDRTIVPPAADDTRGGEYIMA